LKAANCTNASSADAERLVFDLSIWKLLFLALIGLVIFGPERLPRIAAQAGRALRDLRQIAENARADLTEGLGPEFRDFDFNDLNPRHFVRKHFWDDLDGDGDGDGDGSNGGRPGGWPAAAASLPNGERPPYDSEAT
jgi:sec-independent protein translocase protein TatB